MKLVFLWGIRQETNLIGNVLSQVQKIYKTQELRLSFTTQNIHEAASDSFLKLPNG